MSKPKRFTLKDLLEVAILYPMDTPVCLSDQKGGVYKPAEDCAVYKQKETDGEDVEVFVLWAMS